MDAPLWQLQFADGSGAPFSYQLLPTAREALQNHPNQEVRTLDDMESRLGVRLTIGAPPRAGPFDPDQVGMVTWRPAVYVAGETPCAGLEIIQFILEYKKAQGLLTYLPQVLVLGLPHGLALPPPWQHAPLPTLLEIPPPFGVQPPRGQRHIIAQLEYCEAASQDAVATYYLTFSGGIYHFRERFEQLGVQGVPVASGDPDAATKKEYVRLVEMAGDDETAKARVVDVLEGVLAKIPVYFCSMVGAGDPMQAWLLQQPSLCPAAPMAAVSDADDVEVIEHQD